MSHPYSQYEQSESWGLVEKAIRDLQENKDIELATPIEYVVGYICEKISVPGKDTFE